MIDINKDLSSENNVVEKTNLVKISKKEEKIKNKFLTLFSLKNFHYCTVEEEEELYLLLDTDINIASNFDEKNSNIIKNLLIEFWNFYFNDYYLIHNKIIETGNFSNKRLLIKTCYLEMIKRILKPIKPEGNDLDLMNILDSLKNILPELNLERYIIENQFMKLVENYNVLVDYINSKYNVFPDARTKLIPFKDEEIEKIVEKEVNRLNNSSNKRELFIEKLESLIDSCKKIMDAGVAITSDTLTFGITENNSLLLS